MKKILVSGCANCPYLRVFNDGSDDGFNSIVRGECTHPSFKIHRDLPVAMMSAGEFLIYKNEDATTVNPQGHPCWCPLPEEIQIYNPTNIKC